MAATRAKLAVRKPYDDASLAFERRAKVVEQVELQPAVQQHLLNIFQASNGRHAESELVGLNSEQRGRLKLLVDKLFQYGLGPRAVLNLAKAARAWALLLVPPMWSRKICAPTPWTWRVSWCRSCGIA